MNRQQKEFLLSLRLQNFKNIFLMYLAKRYDFFLKWVKVRPLFATIKLTNLCNSQCRTCDHWKNKSSKRALSSEEILNLEQSLYDLGCRSIRFSGGEPLLHREIELFIKQAKKIGFKKIILATNGLLLGKKAKLLKNLTNITVSIDGLSEANDYIRGVDGYFDRAIAGIKEIKKINGKINIEIASNIWKSNFGDIPELINLCKKLGVSWYPNLLTFSPFFFDAPQIKKLDPSTNSGDKIDMLVKSMLEKRKKDRATMNINPKQIKYIRDFLLTGKYPKYCLFGFLNIFIDYQGDIYPCWCFKSVGNIRDDSLAEVISSPEHKKRAINMFYRRCPQCTCGWAYNVMFENL
jgi:MoaA/NifB/PqqE/SkfB family radical SAM enzyme